MRYDHWLMLLRGLSSDAISAGFAALLALATYKRHYLFFVLSLAWAYFHAANIDYIEVNRSYLPFAQLDEALDQTFLLGSAFSYSVLSKFVMLWASLLPVWFVVQRRPSMSMKMGFISLSLAAGAIALVPYQVNIADWKQLHPIEGNASVFFYRHFVDEEFAHIRASKEVTRRYRHVDLSGNPRFTYQNTSKLRNVIILAVEGLSNQHIEHGMMPYLRSLKNESLYVPNFLALNRMTLNGTYAINCGSYPPLASRNAQQLRAGVKTVEFLNEPRTLNSVMIRRIARKTARRHPCLPKVLAKAGYQTVYLQSAGLGYMRKKSPPADYGIQGYSWSGKNVQKRHSRHLGS